MQVPIIEEIEEMLLLGSKIETSLANDQTFKLWSSFMPKKKNIQNLIGSEVYSVQVYPEGYQGQPEQMFTKWATVEVSSYDHSLETLEKLIIPKGKYAKFTHEGDAKQFYQNINYIYRDWFPSSGFELDKRPQLTVMGEKYLGENNPKSQEEIWVPIK